MNRKSLSFLLSLILLLSFFVSCESETVPESTSDVQTEESSTSVPETEAPKYEDVVPNDMTKTFGAEELKLTPYCAIESHSCVKAEIVEGACRITPFLEGQDEVVVYNTFSEKTTIKVTVKQGLETEYELVPFEKPLNSVTINKADRGQKDLTTELQNAINDMSKKGGGTVYVNAGSYKMGTISMQNGVDLRFEGFVPDSRVGYTAKVQEYAVAKNIAKIESNGSLKANFYFLNVDLPQSYCTSGHSDFSISGGFFNCNAAIKFIGMSCADDVVFENIIIKDVPNNHAFQIEGCSNVILHNLMFAGYYYTSTDSVLTRETIQLEPTTPGAIGANYETNVIQCNNGDYHHCYNVKITGCYFGKSDKYGPQLVAVGHHSSTGALVCDGFEFSGNVVDNPLYCGLHLPNYNNVTISGNTFISTKAATASALATDTALISLYCFDNNLSYTNTNGQKIIYSYNYEQPGIQNFYIYDNEFIIGGGTHLRAFRCEGTDNYRRNFAEYVSSTDLRVNEYNGTPYTQNGYIIKTNCAYNINLYNNTFTVQSQPKYNNGFVTLSNICGFTFDNNTITLAEGVSFRNDWNGCLGISESGLLVGTGMYTRKIVMKQRSTQKLYFEIDGKTVLCPAPGGSETVYFNLLSDGNGSIDLSTDAKGNLTVRVTAFEGYSFAGWKNADGTAADFSVTPAAASSFTATFNKK